MILTPALKGSLSNAAPIFDLYIDLKNRKKAIEICKYVLPSLENSPTYVKQVTSRTNYIRIINLWLTLAKHLPTTSDFLLPKSSVPPNFLLLFWFTLIAGSLWKCVYFALCWTFSEFYLMFVCVDHIYHLLFITFLCILHTLSLIIVKRFHSYLSSKWNLFLFMW